MENTTAEFGADLDLWAEEPGAAIAAGGCTTNCAATAGSASTFGCPFGTLSTAGTAGSSSCGC